MEIKNAEGFLTTLESGPYAWPGGYPLYYVTKDCEALSFEAARENQKLIAEAIRDGYEADWIVVSIEINWEDPELFCCHSNKRIESAYA